MWISKRTDRWISTWADICVWQSEKARLPKDGNFVYNRYYDAVTGDLVLAPRDDKRQLAKPLDLGGIVGRNASASTARKVMLVVVWAAVLSGLCVSDHGSTSSDAVRYQRYFPV